MPVFDEPCRTTEQRLVEIVLSGLLSTEPRPDLVSPAGLPVVDSPEAEPELGLTRLFVHVPVYEFETVRVVETATR